MSYPLTSRGDELLAFIAGFLMEHGGIAPTYDEMKDALGLKSKSGVHRMLGQLEERGAIRRLPGRVRCIELTDDCSVELPPELYRQAARLARLQGRSIDDITADAVRELIARQLGKPV